MPSYNNSPFSNTPIPLEAGFPAYLLGSFATDTSPTRMRIIAVGLASGIATVTGLIFEGNAPVVGSLISIQGSTQGGGQFNVTNAVVTAATTNALTGIGTVSFALTGSTVAAGTADVGQAVIPQGEIGEVIANGSSIAATSPLNDPNTGGARTYQAVVAFPTMPTAATVTLQTALVNRDSEYQSLGTVATVAGSAITQSQAQFSGTLARFLRFNVSGLSGTGTIVAKVMA